MDFIKNHKGFAGLGALTMIAVLAFLAFGVFGIHTAFIDKEVAEANPFAEAIAGNENVSAQDGDEDAKQESSDDSEGASETSKVKTIASGSFVDSSLHSGTGDAVIVTDGEKRFLRFKDNFKTDNGPALSVFLRADGDRHVDLGKLKGNIGSQNYEIPTSVNLDEFNRVDVYCTRFSVSFTTANLT